jgi:hypothetical protein
MINLKMKKSKCDLLDRIYLKDQVYLKLLQFKEKLLIINSQLKKFRKMFQLKLKFLNTIINFKTLKIPHQKFRSLLLNLIMEIKARSLTLSN